MIRQGAYEIDRTSDNFINYIQISDVMEIVDHSHTTSFEFMKIIHRQITRQIASLNEANEEARVNLV